MNGASIALTVESPRFNTLMVSRPVAYEDPPFSGDYALLRGRYYTGRLMSWDRYERDVLGTLHDERASLVGESVDGLRALAKAFPPEERRSLEYVVAEAEHIAATEEIKVRIAALDEQITLKKVGHFMAAIEWQDEEGNLHPAFDPRDPHLAEKVDRLALEWMILERTLEEVIAAEFGDPKARRTRSLAALSAGAQA